MHAFVVLGLFFSYQAKRLAWGNVSEMNCFVLSGTYADLHVAQLLPLPLTVSCFSKIQISFNFLVLAYPDTPGKGPLNGVCGGGT